MIALGIAAYLEYGPGPKTLATLDVSSVELSFSEEESAEEAMAPGSAAVAAPEIPEIPEKPEIPEIPETPETPEIPETPKALAVPDEPEQMVTPPRREPAPESAAEGSAGQSAPAARQAKIDAPPRQRSSIRPDYPKGARQRGEQGDVVLTLAIGKSGEVERVSVAETSGFPELDDAAVAAAKKARFTPARSGGKAVASQARLKLTFKLR